MLASPPVAGARSGGIVERCVLVEQVVRIAWRMCLAAHIVAGQTPVLAGSTVVQAQRVALQSGDYSHYEDR